MAVTSIKSKKHGFTYQVDYRYKDKLGVNQRHVKSGFLSSTEAKKYEDDFKMQLALEEEQSLAHNKTINDVFEEYMEVEGQHKYARASITYYRATHKMYVKDKFGLMPITGVKYKNLQKHFNEMGESYNFPTLKNMKKVFSVTFQYAMRAGYVKDNPVKLIQLPKQSTSRRMVVETISDEDLNKIIDEMQKVGRTAPCRKDSEFKFKSCAMAIIIGRYTGLRVSEVLALKKSDFDLENHTLTIQRRIEYSNLLAKDIYLTDKLKSKNSKATVAISKKLSNQLKEWFEFNPHEFVICDSDGELVRPETFNVRIRKVVKIVGVHFHFHMLRHTYATELMMAGINPVTVKGLLRHSEVATTWNTYTHPTSKDQREVLDNLYMKME